MSFSGDELDDPELELEVEVELPEAMGGGRMVGRGKSVPSSILLSLARRAETVDRTLQPMHSCASLGESFSRLCISPVKDHKEKLS